MESTNARRALSALLAAPINRVRHGLLVYSAWDRRASLSAYEAVYVSLAARLGCALLTADQRLARVPALGVTITLAYGI